MRVAACTITPTSGPESGVKVMEVPFIDLIAPIFLAAAPGAVPCACALVDGSGGADAENDEAAALIAKSKIVNIDALVSLIRPSINLHAPMAPELLIYKVLREEKFT
jgi:hypothetical protein